MARSSAVPGVSINDLTDPTLLDVCGNAALSGVPVTVSGREPSMPVVEVRAQRASKPRAP